jgi:nucleoside-diphosphate-sugar epimerase
VRRVIAQSYIGWNNIRAGGPVKTEEDPLDPRPPAAQARALPIVGGGTGVWSLVHVDDAADATIDALTRRAPGIYNIVDDDPAPVAEWLPHLAAATGAKPPRRVPVWLGRPAAGEVGVSMMTQIRGSTNEKAKRELGWELRWLSWREGFVHGLTDAGTAGSLRAA